MSEQPDPDKGRDSGKNRKLLEEIQKSIPEDAARRLQTFLSHSLSWSGQQLEKLSDSPFVDRTGFAKAVRSAGDELQKAANQDPTELLESTLVELQGALEGAFQSTMASYRLADTTVRRSVLENVPAVSVLGSSFRSPDHDIRTSLRRNGTDESVNQFLEGFRKSGHSRIVFFVPGLFSDESLWTQCGSPKHFASLAESLGGFAGFFRFPPLESIIVVAGEFLSILQALRKEIPDVPMDIVTYSEGGLIVRAALYRDQNEIQGPESGAITAWIRHILMISSPDGGSFLEKMGFWIGLGLAGLSQLAGRLINYPEMERSPAIKDLSLGRIRESDSDQLYFGELDKVPCTQVYSLISKNNNVWESWLGDGVVEETSLAYLSARVYASKPNPSRRVHCILGKNHFEILNDESVSRILTEVWNESF
ncbi:MAG: hypothetical protein KDK37_15315 [Leptospiraceae bacterium]|nr:hypothetical protein [Leptospiraceae bacterium]